VDAQPILKKTLVTVAVMVGAWVAFVGTLAVVALVVTSHLVGASSGASHDDAVEVSDPAGRHLPGSFPPPPARGGHDKSPSSGPGARPDRSKHDPI
jgi:hypothetical protein